MKSVVTRHASGEEPRESPKSDSVSDASAQLAQVPVLDGPQHQRSQHLLRTHAGAAVARLAQRAIEIVADAVEQLGVLVEEIREGLKGGLERDLLEGDVGEGLLANRLSHTDSIIKLSAMLRETRYRFPR